MVKYKKYILILTRIIYFMALFFMMGINMTNNDVKNDLEPFFGEYEKAKFVSKPLFSNHAITDADIRTTYLYLQKELFIFKQRANEIRIERPTYYEDLSCSPDNHYGFKYDDEFGVISKGTGKLVNEGCRVFLIEGNDNVRIVVSGERVYIDLGLMGVFEMD